jgi:hypothetical protein
MPRPLLLNQLKNTGTIGTNDREARRYNLAMTRKSLSTVVFAGAVLLLSGCAASAPAESQDNPQSSQSAGNSGPSRPASPQPAQMSWQDACVLSVADVAAVLAPIGITIDHTDNAEANLGDPPSCAYDGPDGSAGTLDITLLPYDISTTDEDFGFLTSGSGVGWRAPDPASGYRNACRAAQAAYGATCTPAIGGGYISTTKTNEALVFLNGKSFCDFTLLFFGGGDAPSSVYQTIAEKIAAAKP